MDVNAKGVFVGTRAVLPGMMSRRRGCMVNTASMTGKRPAARLAHYVASKWARIGFTKSAAIELAPHNMRVNCVCPGYVATSMQEREWRWEADLRGPGVEDVRAEYVRVTPLGRLEQPEDVAQAVHFLNSPAAEFVTGAALDVTGGANLL